MSATDLTYACTSLVIASFCGLVGWVAWLVLRGSPSSGPGGSPSSEVPDYPPPWLDEEETVREPRMRPRA